MQKQKIYNKALRYLGKYNSSKWQVQNYLKKKFPEAEFNEIINSIIQKLQDLNYIDDTRYTSGQINRLINSGKSSNYIKQYLQNKGIDKELTDALISQYHNIDYLTALIFAKKKKIGGFREQEKSPETYKKELNKMAQAGFSFAISNEIIKSTDQNDLEQKMEDLKNQNGY